MTGNINWNGFESRPSQFRKIPDQFCQGCSYVMVLKLMLLSLNDIYRELQVHGRYLWFRINNDFYINLDRDSGRRSFWKCQNEGSAVEKAERNSGYH